MQNNNRLKRIDLQSKRNLSVQDQSDLQPRTQFHKRKHSPRSKVRIEGQFADWKSSGADAARPQMHELIELYDYVMLKRVFPWVKKFRAGFVVISTSEPTPALLMVYQNETIADDGKVIPARRGMPKGSADPNDMSAFETAYRELREETSLDVFQLLSQGPAIARLAPTAFVMQRRDHDMDELHIYFLMVVSTRPQVTVCGQEINAYEWVKSDAHLRKMPDIACTTRALFNAMDEFNVNLIKNINDLYNYVGGYSVN